ncbi:MAG: hypothetical protein MZV70_39445 [Desulfobacterales bacterium]|nr:hypothetical protein [Desulfobacterales bacterium]
MASWSWIIPATASARTAPRDGVALVDAGNSVVQFLSYEGAFTAANGPAAGLASADIGVAEAGTEPLGRSLQLSGSGIDSTAFVWTAPAASTFGAFNTGQTFGGGGGGGGGACGPNPHAGLRDPGVAGRRPRSPATVDDRGRRGGRLRAALGQRAAARVLPPGCPPATADPATSDGLFVFTGSGDAVERRRPGARHRARRASSSPRRRSASTAILETCGVGTVAPVDVHPAAVPTADFLERFEGMLVRLPQSVYVTEHFQLGRFGPGRDVASGGRPGASRPDVARAGGPAAGRSAGGERPEPPARRRRERIVENSDPDRASGASGQCRSQRRRTRCAAATGPAASSGVMTYTWSGNGCRAATPIACVRCGALGGGMPVVFEAANPRPATAPAGVGGIAARGELEPAQLTSTPSMAGPTRPATARTASAARPPTAAAPTMPAEFERQWPPRPSTPSSARTRTWSVSWRSKTTAMGRTAPWPVPGRPAERREPAPGSYAFIDADAAARRGQRARHRRDQGRA